MDFFGMGPMEILLILIVALLVFGPGKLPEIGRGIGRSVREFRKAVRDLAQNLEEEPGRDKPQSPPAGPAER